MANSAEAKTISTISEFFFEIPPYQRLYEWRKEQIETLLEDIKKALNEDRDVYFIGNVVVSEENGRYILIDGQQRLTTLFLIGVYLATRSEIENNSWKNFVKNDKQIRISMPLRENEEQWLSDFINKQNKSDNDFKDLSKKNPNIHYRITKGLETIAEWFEKNTPKEESDEKSKLASFAEYLYGNNEASVRFALVELAEGTDLNQFFVRMNNRGKQLEKHEILKARLLGILQKKDTSGEWKKYAKIWDLCSDMDKYIFQSASDRNILNSPNDGIGNTNNVPEPSLLNILTKDNVKNNGVNTYENNGVERVKSIIDFPTFLLHVAKLEEAKDIPINKDKLLENIVVLKSGTQSGVEDNKEKKIFFEDNNKDGVKNFILDILKYRILFDYFVIKHMADENLSKSGEYSIRRLVKDDKGYFSIGGSVMAELTMLQNYLRVARAGDRQNYHHWLTPFLKKIAEIHEVQMALKKMFLPIQKVCENYKSFDDIKIDSINKIGKEKVQYDEMEEELVNFLEKLDTNLAYAQMGKKPKSSDNDNLLAITKQYLEGKDSAVWSDEGQVDFQANLNQGTGTPHYWFYRLEYYLWKSNKIDDQSFDKKKFGEIKQNFRFRGLNSVEHIQPQSKVEGNWQNEQKEETRRIDCFGNLALVSQSFNSSLSNQDTGDKILDLRKKVNKDDVESLKLWLAYAKIEKAGDEWKYDGDKNTAVEHQREMIQILSDSMDPQKK